MGKAKKKERKNKKSKQKICTFKHFFIPLHSLLRDKANGDPLAQLVEHNTFNVGVLGSSPKRITKQKGYYLYSILFLLYIYAQNIYVQNIGLSNMLCFKQYTSRYARFLLEHEFPTNYPRINPSRTVVSAPRPPNIVGRIRLNKN